MGVKKGGLRKKKVGVGMRKSKYKSHVVPHFEDIFYWYSHDWRLKDIAKELGVAESSFMEYKKKNVELSDCRTLHGCVD